MSSEVDSPAAPARAPRKRRLTRVAVSTVVALVVLSLAATTGIGWYFSGAPIEVIHEEDYPFTVKATGNGTVTLPRDEVTVRPGTWALAWKDGRAMLGPVVGTGDGTVVRRVTGVTGSALTEGLDVTVDHWVYDGDPKTALGLDFREVTYPSKLGPMPAWLIPGRTPKSTWVIGVHGHNADKAETFRAMRAVNRQGLPMLSIAYRNDIGAPKSPDKKNHLGDTEWNDVASAIAYARANGATGVVLYGWSMGGAMVMTTLRHTTDPGFVRGVVLDSPVMDWAATLDKQGADRYLPGFVIDVARWMLERRIGIDLDDFDQRRYAPDLKTPALMFTTDDDTVVDNGPSLAFAEAAPAGMVTHVSAHGDHTEAWNADPAAYEGALDTFLRKIRE